jgi:cystinosin
LGGNPAKFFLGFTSMVFDIVFMVQHYVLYRENNERLQAEEEEARGGYSALVGDKAASLNDAV